MASDGAILVIRIDAPRDKQPDDLRLREFGAECIGHGAKMCARCDDVIDYFNCARRWIAKRFVNRINLQQLLDCDAFVIFVRSTRACHLVDQFADVGTCGNPIANLPHPVVIFGMLARL